MSEDQAAALRRRVDKIVEITDPETVEPSAASVACPSPTADGRLDRCGQFAHPKRCTGQVCTMPDAKTHRPVQR